MKLILEFLSEYQELEIVKFEEDMLFEKPVSQWHKCDCIIAFYSTGFPFEKALEYVNLFKPF